jgi:hypothetical protein
MTPVRSGAGALTSAKIKDQKSPIPHFIKMGSGEYHIGISMGDP